MTNLPVEKIRCSKCGAESPAQYDFCELDGTPLHKPAAQLAQLRIMHICRCGAPVVSPVEPESCQGCGQVWEPRNHVEYDWGDQFAAVTDRGILHARNEDDVRLACNAADSPPSPENAGVSSPGSAADSPPGSAGVPPAYRILAVCDGLSSTQLANEASASAAQALCQALVAYVHANSGGDPAQAMSDAVMKAHKAVCAIPYDKADKGPPGTTIVAALLLGAHATIGWIGDSRAYVTSSAGSKLLTRDHSWANEAVDSGSMSFEEAMRSFNAHVITHCIGAVELEFAGKDPTPAVVSVELPASSWLVLCSDGLWNYADNINDFETVVKSAPERANALTFARHLVAFANAQGGRDNITVAVAGTQ